MRRRRPVVMMARPLTPYELREAQLAHRWVWHLLAAVGLALALAALVILVSLL